MCLAAPAAVPGVLTCKAGKSQASVLSLCDMGEAPATASATRHLLWAPSLSPSGQACREQAPGAVTDTERHMQGWGEVRERKAGWEETWGGLCEAEKRFKSQDSCVLMSNYTTSGMRALRHTLPFGGPQSSHF